MIFDYVVAGVDDETGGKEVMRGDDHDEGTRSLIVVEDFLLNLNGSEVSIDRFVEGLEVRSYSGIEDGVEVTEDAVKYNEGPVFLVLVVDFLAVLEVSWNGEVFRDCIIMKGGCFIF